MATKTGGSSCIWLAALHVAAAVIHAQPDSTARAANQASPGKFSTHFSMPVQGFEYGPGVDSPARWP